MADLEVQVQRLTGRRNSKVSEGEGASSWPIRLYVSCARYRPGEVEAAEQLCLILERLSVLDLFEMARQTRDPFPWLVLINCLDAISTLGVDTSGAENGLMEVVNAMLRVQGLDDVPLPRLLAVPTGTHKTLSAISS